MTRARNRLYLVECCDSGKDSKSLASFAFRCFRELELVKDVTQIDEKQKEMTPQQHKARGVLYVTQAIDLDRSGAPTSSVREKFEEAREHFAPNRGNDKVLLDQCAKHMDTVLAKRSLLASIRAKFFCAERGTYELDGRFSDLLQLEQELHKFFSMGLGDSFLLDEMREVLKVVEELFEGTPYWQIRFREVCCAIRRHLNY